MSTQQMSASEALDFHHFSVHNALQAQLAVMNTGAQITDLTNQRLRKAAEMRQKAANVEGLRASLPELPGERRARFERAYVHHLVKSGEILGAMLMTQHNLWFYQRVMQGLRDAIGGQRLKAFAAGFLKRYRGHNPPPS